MIRKLQKELAEAKGKKNKKYSVKKVKKEPTYNGSSSASDESDGDIRQKNVNRIKNYNTDQQVKSIKKYY